MLGSRFLFTIVTLTGLCGAQNASDIKVRVVRNVPFSAESETEDLKVLADGSRVTQKRVWSNAAPGERLLSTVQAISSSGIRAPVDSHSLR